MTRPVGTVRVPPPDDTAHEDGLLMHELTVVNTLLGRYVLRYLDADAERTDPIPPGAERALADRLASAAHRIHARAARRDDGPPERAIPAGG